MPVTESDTLVALAALDAKLRANLLPPPDARALRLLATAALILDGMRENYETDRITKTPTTQEKDR